MKTRDLAKLVKDARDGATGSDMQIGELLRVCMRIGHALSNTELINWARKEASGYDPQDTLPDYRILSTEAYGNFSGPMQATLKNAQIPKSIIDQKHQDILFTVELRQPVVEIQDYAQSAKSRLSVMWSGDAVAYYQDKEIYSHGFVLSNAWNPISPKQLLGVVEIIRTRVLDFMMQIETELNINVDEPETNNLPPDVQPQQITNIFHNTISGENVAMSNFGNAQTTVLDIKTGDLEGLKNFLTSHGISSEEVSNLERAILDDPKHPSNRLGPRVAKWLGNLTVKSIKNGLTASRDIAATIIAEAVMRYYGMK